MCVILLAAFALRLFRLGAASLWYDETVSVILAQKDLLALTQHTAGDIHPPFYYYLLHFWGRLAGWSEFAVAFLSLFFGVILIALVYRVARAWTFPSPVERGRGEGVGVIAAFLVAVSPYNLWYAQETRMYTLGATLGLASVYFFVRVIGRQSSVVSRQSTVRRDVIAYAIISALGLYTLYYFAFLIIFENLVALVWFIQKSKSRITNASRELRITNASRDLRVWISSQLATALLFAPWLPIAFRQATDPPVPPWRSLIALPTIFIESFSALAFGQSLDPAQTWLLLIVLAALIVFTIATDRATLSTYHLPITNALFLFAYTFIPLTLIAALSFWKPLYHVRYAFLYAPAFYILIARGIAQMRELKIDLRRYASSLMLGAVVFGAALFFSASNFWFEPRYAKDDLRGAMQYLAARWRPGDAVLINAGYTYTAFEYYFDQPIAARGRLTNLATTPSRDGAIVLQTGSIGGGASLGWGDPASDFYATTADETRAALDRVFAAHPRVWMVRLYDTVVDPDGIIRDYLATRGRIIDDQGFAGESYTRVQGYITSRDGLVALPTRATRRDILIGNRIALIGFEPATAPIRAGQSLDLVLYWQAREPVNLDLHLYVGVFDTNNKPIAMRDELPIGNALGTSRWTPGEILRHPIRVRVPASLAPGNYSVRVALYNPRTNEMLDAAPGEWIADTGQIDLTPVQIEK
ncbi:MAG: glycosyltransferase family 39 protein [Chloroflexi bacterium]|nr:glycosyltransferase family 39 protein [Chloroflexota bacterium]